MLFVIVYSYTSITLTSAPMAAFFLVEGEAVLRMNQRWCHLSKGLFGSCGRQKVYRE